MKDVCGIHKFVFFLVRLCFFYGCNKVDTKGHIKPGISCHFHNNTFLSDMSERSRRYASISNDNRVLSSQNKSSFPVVIHCS